MMRDCWLRSKNTRFVWVYNFLDLTVCPKGVMDFEIEFKTGIRSFYAYLDR